MHLSHEILDFFAGGGCLPPEATLRDIIAGPGSLGDSPLTVDQRSTGGESWPIEQARAFVEAAFGIITLCEEAGGLPIIEPIANIPQKFILLT